MIKALQALFPFAPAPSIGNALVWGVWNRRQKCWAETPAYGQEVAERIAAAMVDAYASAFARPGAKGARPYRGLRFLAQAFDVDAWGAWDQARERWAEPARYELRLAERIAASLNEAFAAGLTDRAIERARRRPRRRPSR